MTAYFSQLASRNHLIYSVSMDGAYLKEGYDLQSVLSICGISDIASDVWVIKDQKVIFSEKNETEYLFYTRTGSSNLAVSKKGCKTDCR